MQITLNPLELTKDQREAVAGFILTFPDIEKVPASALKGSIRPVEVPAPTQEDPAAVFGPAVTNVPAPPAAVATGPISAAGPVLVIPSPADVHPSQGAELDKAGFPWNERIHAGGKTKNANGTWRKRRGISDELITEVEAELRALMAIPSPAPIAAAPVVPPPPGSDAPAAVPPPPVDLRAQFVALVHKITAAQTSGKLTEVRLTQILAFAGIGSFNLLATRLDLVPTINAEIDKVLAE